MKARARGPSPPEKAPRRLCRGHGFALAALLVSLWALVRPLGAQVTPTTTPRPLSLDEALRLAAGTSESVAIARAGFTTARGLQIASRAERLPLINSSFSYSRTLASQFSGLNRGGGAARDSLPTPPLCSSFRPDPSLPLAERVDILEEALGCLPTTSGAGFNVGEIGFGQRNTHNIGLSLYQPIYLGGQIRAQNELAAANLRSAALEVTAQNAQLVVTVTQAYYDALLSARLLAIAEASLAQAEETLRFSELAFQVGDQAEYDVLRARVARNNQRNNVLQQRSNRDLAFFHLKQQLDLPLDEEVLLTTDLNDGLDNVVRLPDWIESAPDTATEIRIPVQQAEAAVTMQEAQVEIARAQGRPNVIFLSDYGLIAYPNYPIPLPNQFRNNWTVGIQVTYPLFDGGRVRGNVVQARGNLEQAEARLLQTRKNAAFDTQTKLEALRTARAALEATAGTIEEARRAYEIAQLRFQEGLANLTEVGDARLALSQAEADRAQSIRNLYVAQVQLLLIADLPITAGAGGLGAPGTGGTPGTGVPTTGVPTTGVPRTGVPTTGVPTTGVPTTGVPNTGAPRTGPPRTSVPPMTPPATAAPHTPPRPAPTTPARPPPISPSAPLPAAAALGSR